MIMYISESILPSGTVLELWEENGVILDHGEGAQEITRHGDDIGEDLGREIKLICDRIGVKFEKGNFLIDKNKEDALPLLQQAMVASTYFAEGYLLRKRQEAA